MNATRRRCGVLYDLAPDINVMTYLLTYLHSSLKTTWPGSRTPPWQSTAQGLARFSGAHLKPFLEIDDSIHRHSIALNTGGQLWLNQHR